MDEQVLHEGKSILVGYQRPLSCGAAGLVVEFRIGSQSVTGEFEQGVVIGLAFLDIKGKNMLFSVILINGH